MYYENTFNGFHVIEWILFGRNGYLQSSKGPQHQKYKQELQFVHPACYLMMLYICIKFHGNILNGLQVTEQTQFCDKWPNRHDKINLSPHLEVHVVWHIAQVINIFLRYLRNKFHFSNIHQMGLVQSKWLPNNK